MILTDASYLTLHTKFNISPFTLNVYRNCKLRFSIRSIGPYTYIKGEEFCIQYKYTQLNGLQFREPDRVIATPKIWKAVLNKIKI